MRPLPGRRLRVLALPLLGLPLCVACDAFDGSRSESNEAESESAQAQALQNGSFGTLIEGAQGGNAPALGLLDASWGRRVDLWALDPADGRARPWLSGVVVAADLSAVAGEVARDLSLATGRERLVVQHALDSDAALGVLRELERGLTPLDGGAVPANAVISLRFDDLLDPARLAAGVALTLDGAPLEPARLELDSAHGVRIDGVHHSARATLELDPQRAAAGGDLALHLGHVVNLAGRGLAAPQVLGFSTGGSAPLDNGVPPFVVGRLDGQLTQVIAGPTPGFYLVEFQFGTAACALAPQLGDVFETAGHTVEVIGLGGPPQGASTGRLRAQVVLGDPLTLAAGAAQLRSAWDSELGVPPACFVRFSPPAALPPAGGVSTGATIVIEFSEPMLAGSVQSTGTWTLAYPTSSEPLKQLVPASVAPDPSLERFSLVPVLPMRHRQGDSERYSLRLADGPNGVTDAAQTPLEQGLPKIEFSLAAAQANVLSDGLTYTFEGLDEDGDLLPDLRGQGFFDLAKGLIGGRPVQRFSGVLDPSQPLLSVMPVTSVGIQNPLNPLGARQMAVWRYIDFGFSLLDDFYHNLDVEGLNWSPSQGVIADQFGEFRMALAHSFFFPDETRTAGLVPAYRFSGLVKEFDADVADALDVVHDKALGYQVSPADSFTSTNGTLLHPWPLNRNIPPDQYTYWTWRDTALLQVAGATGINHGIGVDPTILGQATGSPGLPGFYPMGKIPSIGMPLLTEYRTYPDPSALGLNQFQTSFAINSSYRPTFRAFSAGGFDAQGQTILVDPDNSPVATGGYTPSGQQTGPIDNTVYWGQADFVMRVSRAHTRWLDTGAAHDFFGQAVVEYGPSGLPPGTQVQLAYRGATSVSAPSGSPWLDAGLYDPYGDGYTQAQLNMLFGLGTKPAFDVVEFPIDDDKGWHDSLDDLDGARWIQVRLTFVADPVANVTPQVAGVAIAWQ